MPIGGLLNETLESLLLGIVVIVRVGVIPAFYKQGSTCIAVRKGEVAYLDRLSIDRPKLKGLVLRPGDKLEFSVVCVRYKRRREQSL